MLSQIELILRKKKISITKYTLVVVLILMHTLPEYSLNGAHQGILEVTINRSGGNALCQQNVFSFDEVLLLSRQ